ncbi:phytanoyl-CoA dioxygenase family protein [Ruegeria atlantica]|uniref:phytanoyl-CoA dioxygenase family protein n=1 Tax=Ruegeria atlantica TaxID=81569 RepID=UPI00147BCA9A|nr:phytanoyl-CoA dioxygenase family protein [Ruegeria atlantica]
MSGRVRQSFGFFGPDSVNLETFKRLTESAASAEHMPFAAGIEKHVPIYDVAALAPVLSDPEKRLDLLSEWALVLGRLAGVIVLRGAFPDTSVIDRATEVFRQIIDEERQSGAGDGDHFAASGANDRVWNALQKQCLRDPEGFALYFGNTAIAAACEAWLGPSYQITAQVNQVRPGGKAQQAHRDYHLGFQSADSAARYPAHAHHLTAALTLQGAVAHCDMPVESGPTKLLPFSQLYYPGYLAFHDPAHREHFEDSYIQLPLSKGDAVFFNPALFHAAGENSSADIDRMANLLQISSAFGRAMEALDRRAMSLAVFPHLLALKQRGDLSASELDAAIAATAEGYPFPTNLDTDPPIGGNAPESQADILCQAVSEGWSETQLADVLSALQARQAA